MVYHADAKWSIVHIILLRLSISIVKRWSERGGGGISFWICVYQEESGAVRFKQQPEVNQTRR